MMREYRPIPFRIERLPHDVQRSRSTAFLETMRSRRSVRFFSDEPVSHELVENAIKAAGTAPSGANQQPWTFVLVTDPAVRRRIRQEAEKSERAFYESNATEWHEALAPLGTDWHKDHLTTAPYLIVVFAHVFGYRRDEETGEVRKIKHYYVQESVGIACGFLLAGLAHAGLVALTHTPSPMGFLAKVLGRPDNERAYVVMPVGYPTADCVVPAITKKALDEILIRV